MYSGVGNEITIILSRYFNRNIKGGGDSGYLKRKP